MENKRAGLHKGGPRWLNSVAQFVACGEWVKEEQGRTFFSLDSAPHTSTPRASHHLANKTVYNAKAIKYLDFVPFPLPWRVEVLQFVSLRCTHTSHADDGL